MVSGEYVHANHHVQYEDKVPNCLAGGILL